MKKDSRIRVYVNRFVSYGLCLVLVGSFPLSVYADTNTDTSAEQPVETSSPVPSEAVVGETTGSTTPEQDPAQSSSSSTGGTETTPAPSESSADALAVDQTDQTGSEQLSEEPEKNYYYDEESKRWNTDAWVFDPETGTYKEAPKPVVITPSDGLGGIDEKQDTSSGIDAETITDISNALDSLAKTGDAGVVGNTQAGSAKSGDASAVATVINNVNSTLTNTNNTEAATFVSDVMGDVNGDIILQPMLLKALLEASAVNTAQDQTINSTNKTNITNDLNLTANSGDATVARNTSAGDATSGDANTVADVVNIVNSMISANQSFMGTINIYGNLNGDILIAPDFLSQLLADNSNNVVQAEQQDQTQQIDVNNTASIVNNVALAAESGSAVVAKNTSAGSATSGDADTNVVLFNLSGHDIVASNSLLVFVNVLGKWVGVILDAPTGTTAAAIGSGVMQNNITTAPSMTINSLNDTAITNNINLASRSGDATVASNTFAGNATSGNATASANIANITNSQLGLSGWFGVLFINVFGTWVGSFGVDTDAGNPIIRRAARMANRNPAIPGPVVASSALPLQVVTYVPREGAAQPSVNTTVVTPAGVQENASQAASVRAAEVFSDPYEVIGEKASEHGIDYPLTIGSIMITLLSLYALRRFLF